MTNKLIGATKKRRSSGNSSRSVSKLMPSFTNWHTLMIGLAIGIALTSLGFYTLSNPEITLKIPATSISTAPMPVSTHHKKAAERKVPEKIAEAPVEPRFDFYSELTKNHNEAYKEKPALVVATPSAPVLDLKPVSKPINGYLVQAGSFKRRADADALKAQLTLGGLEAKIEAAKLNDGKLWHRVILGPFKTEKTCSRT